MTLNEFNRLLAVVYSFQMFIFVVLKTPSYEDWAAHYAQALWLEQYRNRNLAEVLSQVFGSDTGPRR